MSARLCTLAPALAPRSYALGFTDTPHAYSLAAVIDAFAVIARDGDLAVMHFDDGVPWDEARSGAPYAPAYEEELERKARSLLGVWRGALERPRR